MKRFNIYLFAFVLAVLSGCTYSFPEPDVPTPGSADFSKVVVMGNSLSAGYMDGALYTAGQDASYARLVALQMQEVGGGEFNQPDIDAENGYFGLDGTTVLGRLILVNPLSPIPTPIQPGQPITAYSGGQPLNNFAVPGMRIVHSAVSGYAAANPYYGRFASAPDATVLDDAKAAAGSFFLFWLGNNDALGYATSGAIGDPDGDGSISIDMTSKDIFETAYRSTVSSLITDGGNKGVLINIPNIHDIPFFTYVKWNAVPFDESDPVDAGTIAALNAGYQPYNDGLDAMVGAMVITQEEADSRKISFQGGNNPVVITDNTLTDLTGYNPALVSMRPAIASDLLTLTSGAVIPAGEGVQSPLGEEYTLTLADQERIADRIADFNAIIKSVVDSSGGDLVLFDFNSVFADFAQNGVVVNGSSMNASFIPPSGAFSLDGVHPNQRGSAFIASQLIDIINDGFGSTIPNINPNDWAGNATPILP